MLPAMITAPIQTISIDIVIPKGSKVPLTIKHSPINIRKIVAAIFI